MKLKTKFISLATVFAVIFLTVSPTAFAAVGQDVTFQGYTGHSLSEDSFSMIYDIEGNEMVKDFTPGSYAGELDDGATDENPVVDKNFYATYTNMGQVHTMYMANQNITLDAANETKYGCAPYQLMINHFRAPGNYEVFVINTFLGLMAYRENATDVNGVPDADEELYLGWTAFSELYKHYFNQGLNKSNIPEYCLFDDSTRSTGTPIQMTKQVSGDDNIYEYGMSYKNIFVVWQKIDIQDGLNETAGMNYANIVRRVAAVCMLDSLNFTFQVKGTNSTTGYTNVTITTEYEIGAVKDLWILGDGPKVANYFGGHNYEYKTPEHNLNITLYNETTPIAERLQGNVSTPGFSVAVANYADVVALGTRPPSSFVRDRLENRIEPDAETKNITRAELMLSVRRRAVEAFEIDFEGKDTYILDGNEAEPLHAPSRVLKNTKLRSPMATFLYWEARDFLVNVYQNIATDFTIADRLRVMFNRGSIFYLTCFPKWNGKSIVNDPTFTVFAGAGTSLGFSITWWQITIVAAVGVGAVSIILIQRKKRV